MVYTKFEAERDARASGEALIRASENLAVAKDELSKLRLAADQMERALEDLRDVTNYDENVKLVDRATAALTNYRAVKGE